MNLSVLARSTNQTSLIAVEPRYKIFNNASARCAYGAAAQEIICAALNLNPIAINGNSKVCFDAEKDGLFYEIKSVRYNNKVVAYNWRMKKEAEFSDILLYAILVHRISKLRKDIIQHMLVGAEIILLPASTVHALAAPLPSNFLVNVKVPSGYSREGYNEGYKNIPVKQLKAAATRGETKDVKVYSHKAQITIYRP